MIWPTKYACPVQGGQASGGWRFVWTVFALSLFYVIGGVAFAMWRSKQPASITLHPHYEFWRSVPALVQEGIAFTIDKGRSLTARHGGAQLVRPWPE